MKQDIVFRGCGTYSFTRGHTSQGDDQRKDWRELVVGRIFSLQHIPQIRQREVDRAYHSKHLRHQIRTRLLRLHLLSGSFQSLFASHRESEDTLTRCSQTRDAKGPLISRPFSVGYESALWLISRSLRGGRTHSFPPDPLLRLWKHTSVEMVQKVSATSSRNTRTSHSSSF
jgi:hypothetical protein